MTCKSFCAMNWANFGLWAASSSSGNVFWFMVPACSALMVLLTSEGKHWAPLGCWHLSSSTTVLYRSTILYWGWIVLLCFLTTRCWAQRLFLTWGVWTVSGEFIPPSQVPCSPPPPPPHPAPTGLLIPCFPSPWPWVWWARHGNINFGVYKTMKTCEQVFFPPTGQCLICLSAQHRSKSLNTNHKWYADSAYKKWLLSFILVLFF